MTETTTTERTESTDREPIEATIERTVASIVRIGRLWAVYGLEAGRASLQATGETLQATSSILRDLSKRLDDRLEDRGDGGTVAR